MFLQHLFLCLHSAISRPYLRFFGFKISISFNSAVQLKWSEDPFPILRCTVMALLPGNCGVGKLFKRNAMPFSGLSFKQPSSFLRLRSLPVACLPPPTSTRNNKLFVTGLSIYTTERTLQNAFSNHGKVVDVRIIMNKTTRRSKGFGFVEFATEEEANTALKEMNGKILNGWLITVDYAKPAPRSGRAPNVPQNKPYMNKEATAEAVDDLRNP